MKFEAWIRAEVDAENVGQASYILSDSIRSSGMARFVIAPPGFPIKEIVPDEHEDKPVREYIVDCGAKGEGYSARYFAVTARTEEEALELAKIEYAKLLRAVVIQKR